MQDGGVHEFSCRDLNERICSRTIQKKEKIKKIKNGFYKAHIAQVFDINYKDKIFSNSPRSPDPTERSSQRRRRQFTCGGGVPQSLSFFNLFIYICYDLQQAASASVTVETSNEIWTDRPTNGRMDGWMVGWLIVVCVEE